MKYGHIVLASTKRGFIPNSIKWFTKSKFSHSFITIPSILDLPMCIEAAEGGVDTTRFDKSYINNKNQGYEVWEVKINKKEKDKAIKHVISDLEIGYGFLQYPYFILKRLLLLFGIDIKGKNNWFRKEGMICSQLCIAYLKACGLNHIMKDYGNGSIAPQDLRDIMTSNPKIFRLINTVRLN